MAIEPISGLKSISSVGGIGSVNKQSEAGGAQEAGVSFKEMVKDAVKEVNHLQSQADGAAVKLATGDVEDVHQSMIAMQKAKLALDLTIQVRNKVIEAYQEIMRMQV